MINQILRVLGHQYWIRFGVRDRVLRLFRNPDTMPPQEYEVDFYGLRYKGRLSSFLDWNLYFYGAHQREYLHFLRQLVAGRSNAVFLDVGANVGQVSLFMSQVCEQVHSFEPNPSVRQRLNESIQFNGIKNIAVHDVGLGERDETLPYFLPKGSNQGTGSFVEGYSDNNQEKTSLRVVNGDRHVAALGLTRIALIKIDVEGYEKYVLAGLQETLRKFRPLISIEYSKATRRSFTSIDEFMSLLPAGYTVNAIASNQPVAKFFNRPDGLLQAFDFERSDGDLLLFPS